MKKTYGIDDDGKLNKGLIIVLQRPWVYRVDVQYEKARPWFQEIMVTLEKGWVFPHRDEEDKNFWGNEVGIKTFGLTSNAVYYTHKRRVKQITQEKK
jgi:hypothetical protein